MAHTEDHCGIPKQIQIPRNYKIPCRSHLTPRFQPKQQLQLQLQSPVIDHVSSLHNRPLNLGPPHTQLAHSFELRAIPPPTPKTRHENPGCRLWTGLNHHFPRKTCPIWTCHRVEYVPDPLEGARALAQAEDVSNITFQEGNIHALPFEDNTFDVVHAHQVLQHIADPVHALKEMRRVAKDGGIVACRESAELSWYPESVGIAKWREVTERMQLAKGGNPHPGRMIHVWAREAGFDSGSVKRSAGAWCFGSEGERAYWGGSMEERARSSGFAKNVVEEGFAEPGDLEVIARGWRQFVEDGDAWFGLLHGEILCWK
ncbi:hypothetical protein N7527_010160 [Penicillium freii]|nr:hypothetical protein N7527_010160 [Penicillium freii]